MKSSASESGLIYLTQFQLNETLYNMMAEQTSFVDFTELWGTRDSIAEALGNSMDVVSHFLANKILGKTTINSHWLYLETTVKQ